MNKFKILPAAAVLIIAATACCSQEPQSLDIIPYPNSVELHCGHFAAAGAEFCYDSGIDGYAEQAICDFAAQLSAASGQTSAVSEGVGSKGFVFSLDESLPAEGYEIEITKKAVKVKASGLNGVLYSIETIKQMLPVAIYGRPCCEAAEQECAEAAAEEWSLPCVSIKDAPRFAYRGQLIDIARHFFDIQEMKKMIDMMLTHKINTLHWHISDDQGWRIEIEKYPRLTSVGSMRKSTCIKKNWNESDGTPHGGFYTKDQIREVVEYAASKGITVIPEIDLPGHMQSALAAYPELGCTGGPYEVWGRWGISEDVLCVGKEKTMQFLEDVLSEVADLFPGEYFHIGGDECPKVRWENCPVCQAKIKELGLEDGEYTAEHYLQSYVMERMEKFLATKGKKIIGWDEILEGTPGPNATVMSWRGTAGGIKASAMGHDVIMTPNNYFYLDYYQSDDIENEPFGIGGYVPIEKVYSFEPYTEEMDENARRHIIGVQANLWTEYIAENWHLEYMLLPRQAALSEVQWCQPENKDWDRFYASIPHETAMYDVRGYTYSTTVYKAHGEVRSDTDKGCVEVTLTAVPGIPIRYTLDGSDPDNSSPLYNAPLEISSGCTLKAAADMPDVKVAVLQMDFCDTKAMAKKVVLNTEPLEKYRFGAPESLVNGIRGRFPYSSGQWAGWQGTPLSVTIDMNGETYSNVTLGTMLNLNDDLFPPLGIKVSTSEDGETFTEQKSLSFPMPEKVTANCLKDYTVDFPETSARYLKVEAETVAALPAWHPRAGMPGFLFTDEIVVK